MVIDRGRFFVHLLQPRGMRCLPTNLVSGAFEDVEDYRMKHVDKKTEPFLKPAKGFKAGRS
jgi:hypothetical protein